MPSTQPPHKPRVDEVIDMAELKTAETRVEQSDGSDTADVRIKRSQTEGHMTKEKWLACIALGLSYTTAFQQNACTAAIVKHIDEELGNANASISIHDWPDVNRSNPVLQLDSQCVHHSGVGLVATVRWAVRHLWAQRILFSGMLHFASRNNHSTGRTERPDYHRGNDIQRYWIWKPAARVSSLDPPSPFAQG